MSILDRFRLTGKKVFITGGSRGLGREMALACADVGADIVMVGRDEESLRKTAADIEALGRKAIAIRGDVAIPEECEKICESAIRDHGPMDILINNVGGRRQNLSLENTSLETWKELIDLNLTSVFLCTKIIGGEMIKGSSGGRVINIASINAVVAGRKIEGRHYETSKAAVVQFTRAMAVDWAKYKITVNAILPGGFMTEPNQRWKALHPEVIESFEQHIPLGHFGDPQDLGPLVVYLASEASRYMTGAALIIDGGYTLL